MSDDRRNDLGSKLMYTIMTAVIALGLGAFLTRTLSIAEEGRNMGFENSKDIAVIQTIGSELREQMKCIDVKLDRLLVMPK
jgi:hypothetical protein